MQGVVLRCVAEVPLAEDGRAIASLLEQLTERDLLRLQASMIVRGGWIRVDNTRNPGTLLVATGHQAGRCGEQTVPLE